MKRIEDIVYYDFQGWPEYKMNLREVLVALGGKVEGDAISFDLKDTLMDVYPRILVDDGMGYRVNENVIVSISFGKRRNYFNIFRERKLSDDQQAELARQADSHMSMENWRCLLMLWRRREKNSFLH